MEKEEAIKILKNFHDKSALFSVRTALETLHPELKEPEDERIRKFLIKWIQDNYYHGNTEIPTKTLIGWLEKQGEIDKISYEIAEKEKREFVGDGFIKCYADFQDFKEGETYWLEYVGNDNYNVRSDNLLGKTYHITPCQLYTIFKKTTWLEIVNECIYGEQKSAWSEEDEKKRKRIMHRLSIDGTINNKDLADINDWLKSLRPQNTWRPSDEQTEALDGICSYIRNQADWEISQDTIHQLYSLSEQLKKLKG